MTVLQTAGPSRGESTNENWGIVRLKGEVDGKRWIKYVGDSDIHNTITVTEESLCALSRMR